MRSNNKQHIEVVEDATILLIQETERLSSQPLRYAEDCSAGPELITAALEFIFQPPLLPIIGHSAILKLIPEACAREPFELELWHGAKTFWASGEGGGRFDFECSLGHAFSLSSDDAYSCPECGSEFLKKLFPK